MQVIVRMLTARLQDGEQFSPKAVGCLEGYASQLTEASKQMRAKMGGDQDALGDVERMDKWFATGFENLVKYLEERVKSGPEMSDRWKAEIYMTLQRAFTCVPIYPSEPTAPLEEADESGSA